MTRLPLAFYAYKLSQLFKNARVGVGVSSRISTMAACMDKRYELVGGMDRNSGAGCRKFVAEYNGLAIPDVGRPLLAKFRRSSYYDRLVAV